MYSLLFTAHILWYRHTLTLGYRWNSPSDETLVIIDFQNRNKSSIAIYNFSAKKRTWDFSTFEPNELRIASHQQLYIIAIVIAAHYTQSLLCVHSMFGMCACKYDCMGATSKRRQAITHYQMCRLTQLVLESIDLYDIWVNKPNVM